MACMSNARRHMEIVLYEAHNMKPIRGGLNISVMVLTYGPKPKRGYNSNNNDNTCMEYKIAQFTNHI